MSLRHAVLAVLLEGPASGYDLAKRFDRSVGNFWHATRQQIYAELARMEADGVVGAKLVVQRGRPDKRLHRISESGRRAVHDWIGRESRPTAIKDEMLVRVQAATAADTPALLAGLGRWREEHATRLVRHRELQRVLLAGRPEDEHLASAERPGGYLTLLRGIAFERENIAWADQVAAVLRARAGEKPLRSRG
jgi:DNA-binding PadR family transcriptional regulator